MPEKPTTKNIVILVAAIGGTTLGLILLGVAAISLLSASRPEPLPQAPPVTESRPLTLPTATIALTETLIPTTAPTETPAASSTPPETPTSSPTIAPTGVPATIIPPTDTPAPTAPPAGAARGLTNITFSVDNPVVAANQRIIFRFSVTNSTAQKIVFGYMGVAVLDASGNNVQFQTSWTGWELGSGQTQSWDDGVTIGTPGTYLLQLSGCFPSVDACAAGQGEWEVLAPAVTVTVN
ncbi:MAG: hypothetical protein Kow00124_31980 [Anaerolineae bacterium]